MSVAAIQGPRPQIHLHALCHDCKRRHEIVGTDLSWLARMADWEVKHRGHRIEFRSPKRVIPRRLDDKLFEKVGRAPWWLDQFKPNADIKLAYAASAAFTIGLQATPLASSATFVGGRESTAVSNTTDKYLDRIVGGKITTGTSPTASKEIRIYAYGSIDDTPTYPDVLDGTDSDETITSADILDACMPLIASTGTSSTSNVTYWFKPVGLAQFFGGLLPKNCGLFVAHNTGVALNSTAGNHALSHTGVYATSA